MPGSMLDVIKVIRPHLSTALVPEEAARNIEQLAAVLAPLYWGGFELTMRETDRRVDLHQGIATRGKAAALAGAPVTSVNPHSTEGWKRIIRFCEEWADPGSMLYDPILKVGLEFDVRSSPAETPAPSVFWSFSDSSAGNHRGNRLFETVITSLEVLTDTSMPAETARRTRRFFDILPDNAALLHAGTMISRSESTLRINVWGLEPRQITGCLFECGWGDATGEVEDILLRLDGSVEDVVTGFDIGTDPPRRVGLECTPARDDGGDYDWSRLLEELIAMDLITLEERKALLEWPGLNDPSSESAEWPAGLIVESLLKEPHFLSLISRSLSHIKIAVTAGAPPRAKAYLEFLPDWADLSSDRS